MQLASVLSNVDIPCDLCFEFEAGCCWPREPALGLTICCAYRFVLHVPENLPLNASAPLLCAGITTYSPLMHYGLNKPGQKLGVVGLGGLGHMAVKIAKAMGLEVRSLIHCAMSCDLL